MNWKCWQRKKKVTGPRRVRANDTEFNAQFKYHNNYISTSKYNILTFLPLNLFEQFTRLANVYFLFLLILQAIPYVSSLSPITTLFPILVVLSVTLVKDLYDDILIKQISSLSWTTTVIPLAFVLLISALKDAVDDIQRHRSDNLVNNRLSWVLRDGELVEAKWQTVVVGDIIKMQNDQFVAADLLLLSASEPNSLCYIETAELDGETNLKVKQALVETADMEDDIEQLSKFNGDVTCEAPNNILSKFEGKLDYNGEVYSLDNDKILLRGCILRNTEWCFGMVIFAGRDTKLMMNSGKTKFKRTHIDKLMNVLIIGIFIFLLFTCLICSIGAGIWEMNFGQYFQVYLPWDYYISGSFIDDSEGSKASGSAVVGVLVFFSYIIVLNTVVPISLYVSVEMIRFGHSWWINWDSKMYHEKSDTPAKCRTTTLNEELGQIEYIFSDKTGTLTQNIMTFNKCSINGVSYGDLVNKRGVAIDITDKTPKLDFSANPYYEKTFDFYDERLWHAVNEGVPEVHEFFRLLALCHTVMSTEKEGVLEYQAQSPDEAALVGAARNFQFVYKSRTPATITLEVMGQLEVYEQLCILDFNNVRKRMSVIVRKDNRITLLCKGADTTIYQLLDPVCMRLQEQTTAHLESFAQDGLRTLCLSSKEIDPNYYAEWKKRHLEASTSLDNRDDKLSAVYEEIEQNMRLLGATAIEDKLQDGVPETIANLASADIKIWVLTGDKQETAINIGYSCQLLTEEMSQHLYVIEASEFDDVRRELTEARNAMVAALRGNPNLGLANQGLSISNETLRIFDTSTTSATNNYNHNHTSNNDVSYNNNITITADNNGSRFNNKSYDNSMATTTTFNRGRPPEFGLIINGHSLTHALKPELELLLLETGCMCKAVICCRVTPLQKALVVSLVKKHKKSVTLSIGDGANDVSMIKMAHIGIGISGQEGLQAVLASDYSIAQFRYLERLLLVHGRWSYLRMCKFLKYFFYKNFAFTLCHFWFAFFCGFSAQTLYDPYFITFYNVFYTSLPVMALGFFEQDLPEKLSLQYPNLYTPGHLNLFFNKKVFIQSVLEGFLTSLVLFFVPYGAYQDAIQADGLDVSGHKSFGLVVASCLIVTVTLRCGLDTLYWTGFNHFVIWGSIVFFFIFTAIMYLDVFNYSYSGVVATVWSTATFWFTLLLTVIVILMTVVAERFYFIDTRPTLMDKLRIQQKVGEIKAKVARSRIIRRASTIRRSQRSVGRSGYAFSHQQGFGDLITSGSIMRRKPRQSDVLAGPSKNNASLVGFTDLAGGLSANTSRLSIPFESIPEENVRGDGNGSNEDVFERQHQHPQPLKPYQKHQQELRQQLEAVQLNRSPNAPSDRPISSSDQTLNVSKNNNGNNNDNINSNNSGNNNNNNSRSSNIEKSDKNDISSSNGGSSSNDVSNDVDAPSSKTKKKRRKSVEV